MENDHIKCLRIARGKLIEKRRAVAKRDSITDRDEGFAERIVVLQKALEAADQAIAEEEELLLSPAEEPAAS